MKTKGSINKLLAFLGLQNKTKLLISSNGNKSITNKLNPLITELKEGSLTTNILINSISDQKLFYSLQGCIDLNSESKPFIKKIKRKKEIIGGILYVKHYIILNKKIENNDLIGINFIQNQILKIPKNINSIKIELYETEIQIDKSQINKLVFEKYITL